MIKIKKINVEKIAAIALLGGMSLSLVYYYNYESIVQKPAIEIDKNDISLDENGDISYVFDVGEHRITLSRNDFFGYKVVPVDGYEIESAEINFWGNNIKATYINKEPVIVKATIKRNGELTFNTFGTVVEEKKNDNIFKLL